jgi:hypothetical protein
MYKCTERSQLVDDLTLDQIYSALSTKQSKYWYDNLESKGLLFSTEKKKIAVPVKWKLANI